jgi:hypothetical protein
MIVRYAIFTLVAVAPLVAPLTVSAKSMSRREIRQSPVLERPFRVGHFYGNAVRRNHS